jgi:hypothetical protein
MRRRKSQVVWPELSKASDDTTRLALNRASFSLFLSFLQSQPAPLLRQRRFVHANAFVFNAHWLLPSVLFS